MLASGLGEAVSESNVVLDDLGMSLQADLQRIIGFSSQSHRGHMISRSVHVIVASAGTGSCTAAALTADVNRVAEVATGRALAHVVVRGGLVDGRLVVVLVGVAVAVVTRAAVVDIVLRGRFPMDVSVMASSLID